MSIEVSGNVIRIPIEIALEDKTEAEGIIKALQQSSPGAVVAEGNIASGGKDDPFFHHKSEIDEDAAGNVMGLLAQGIMNPTGVVKSTFIDLLPYMIEALIAAGLADKLIEYLQAPGGPLDIRFKRQIQDETFGEFTRQEQQARRIGLEQVIITSFGGFHNYNGANVANTFRQLRQFGHTEAGMLDKAKGGTVVTL